MKALSIVAPYGTKIANREKIIEVRSWKPTIPLHQDLLIVENKHYLKENEIDADGRAVAIVKIKYVREFIEEDIQAACATRWQAGYFSWELYDIRPLQNQQKVLAAREIYDIDLDFWSALSIEEINSLFSHVNKPYWISGGVAIDLYLQENTRIHEDIDISIRREDQLYFQQVLFGWDLKACDPPGSGQLRTWDVKEVLKNEIHNIWCRQNVNGPWNIELLLTTVEGDEWVYRRNSKIRGHLSTFDWRLSDGTRVIAPEIQLLYKSKNIRTKDQIDFEKCLKKFDHKKKNWLLEKILIDSGENHPWVAQLRM